MHVCVLNHFSCVQLFVTPWAITFQAPLPMEFSRQEYWSGLPCPPPRDLPNPGIELASPALQADSLLLSHQGSLMLSIICVKMLKKLNDIQQFAYNAEDRGSILGLGGSLGEENGNPLWYSCLENSMDRGAWQATIHGVTKNRTQLSY